MRRGIRVVLSFLTVVLAHAATPVFAQVAVGPQFQVNAYTTDYQGNPHIAFGRAGSFVVSWTSRPFCPGPPPVPPPPCDPGQDGHLSGVFARRYDASGVPGAEFQVNVATASTQVAWKSAGLPDGRFVILWTSAASGAEQIVGRFLASSGAPVGGEFVAVPAVVPPPQLGMFSAIAALPGSEFVVAWQSGTVPAVSTRRFDAHGSALGAEFMVAPGQLGDVASDASGNYIVTWATPAAEIAARRFDRSGTPLGPEFAVNTYITGFQIIPRVAADSAGNFVIVWSDERRLPHARRFDSSGVPMGTEFSVAAAVEGFSPAIAAATTGETFVVWPGNTLVNEIAGRMFDRNGVPGPEFRVDAPGTNRKTAPTVAFDDAGNAVVAWEADSFQDGSRTGVFAQRFGGLRPAGMAVDPASIPTSDGNGVFEPGETVSVEPAWRNVSGAVMLPFTGAATSFAGPSGSFYSIFDATADYPLAVSAAVARCHDASNCFSMGVASPSGRPAVHWDASFVEDLGPNAPSLAKRWSVHLGDSLSDVPRSSPFYRFVETLLHNSVTSGCTATGYCPGSSTSREQMAVFALVAKEGAGYAPAACGAIVMFNDVPVTSPFCRWVEELARRGVVAGCTAISYCPLSPVTREQMAVFALKTLEGAAYLPPVCATPMYGDVPASSPFCRYIEELTRRAVVAGCGGGLYCPTSNVSREQMSVFLTVTFSLQLYGP